MQKVGHHVERQHHEVATAGQAEIDMRFDSLVKMADKLMLYKYIVKNVAKRNGKTATFMPKPLFGDNGSGMHTHQSIWKDGKTALRWRRLRGPLPDGAALHRRHPEARPGCSRPSRNPTTNSYKRLVPGYEAPVNMATPAATAPRPSASRCTPPDPKAKRVEFRYPDPSCNPYLAFAAMLMAGLDGIENKIDPAATRQGHLRTGSRGTGSVPTMPAASRSADNLEADHKLLLKGDVFTKDAIEMWINYKRTKEVDALRLRPHPYEFSPVLRHLRNNFQHAPFQTGASLSEGSPVFFGQAFPRFITPYFLRKNIFMKL